MRRGILFGFGLALTALAHSFLFFTPLVSAEEESFYCEVLAVEGTAYLTNAESFGKAIQEGDLLKADDEIETGQGVSVDLAFDKEWSNVTRIEENTKIVIRSVFPTRLYVERGALYAKLKSLPKDSIFRVETPTAIAAVRGTEYRTEYADGETLVSNDSEAETSQVYLYEPSGDGELKGEPVVLPRAQFTGIAPGQKPRPHQPMTAMQRERCQKARGVLDHKIRENISRGRVGKIQDLRAMENFGQRMKQKQQANNSQRQKRQDENRISGPNNDNHPPAGSRMEGREGGPGQGEGFSPRRDQQHSFEQQGQMRKREQPLLDRAQDGDSGPSHLNDPFNSRDNRQNKGQAGPGSAGQPGRRMGQNQQGQAGNNLQNHNAPKNQNRRPAGSKPGPRQNK